MHAEALLGKGTRSGAPDHRTKAPVPPGLVPSFPLPPASAWARDAGRSEGTAQQPRGEAEPEGGATRTRTAHGRPGARRTLAVARNLLWEHTKQHVSCARN